MDIETKTRLILIVVAAASHANVWIFIMFIEFLMLLVIILHYLKGFYDMQDLAGMAMFGYRKKEALLIYFGTRNGFRYAGIGFGTTTMELQLFVEN